MSEASSSGQKRSSQECMEVDETTKDRGDSLDAPPSVKKAKEAKDVEEEAIEEKTSEISLNTPHKKESKEMENTNASIEKSPRVSPSKKNDKKVKKEVDKSMEVEDVDESLEKSPEPSSSSKKKATPVKKAVKDEFEFESDGEEEVVEVPKKKKEVKNEEKEGEEKKEVKKEEEVEEAPKKELSKRQKRLLTVRKDITKMWVDEEPYVNVERPFPSKTDRAHFCWYDLSEEWAEDSAPRAVPVDKVDRRFNYGWREYAHLPFSVRQTHYSQGTCDRPRGELISEAIRSFSNGVRDLKHLESGIRTYWDGFRPRALEKLFDDASEEVCGQYLKLLTEIAMIARKSEELVTRPLPLLLAEGTVKSVSMSQEQAASLLAYSFFCAVLPRDRNHFNHFSFHQFHCKDTPIFIEKMKFILYYFKAVSEEMPGGTLTYSRQTWDFRKDERLGFDKWEEPLSEMLATSDGLIEEMAGCLQVDFANEYIGGGVMNMGAVQEEIRFLCCPEMLVSLFLCDAMDKNEAILIQGAQQYSAYEGYSNKLKHVPLAVTRNEPRDRFGRARSYLVAIDAVCYGRRSLQYEMRMITREIKKAYAGFMCVGEGAPTRPIATGNWGCGVFNGDRELKSLIQLIAASKAGRAMIYVTFNDEDFAEELEGIVDMLKTFKITNGQLFSLLIKYESKKQLKERVFEYLRRALTSGV